MPSATPAPRRASSAARPGGAKAKGSPRPPRPGEARRKPAATGRSAGAGESRTRDGAPRRIERGAAKASRYESDRTKRDREEDTREPTASYGVRRPDRYERSDGDRRPRPASAGRSASRDPRSSTSRAPGSLRRTTGKERFERDDRDRRPSTPGQRAPYARRSREEPRDGEGRANPRTNAARPSNRYESRGERPDDRRGPQSRAPRSSYDTARSSSGSRGQSRARELSPEELARQKANTYGQKKGWGGVARRGAVSIKSEGPAMETTKSAGNTPDPLSAWVKEVRPSTIVTAIKAKAKVKYSLPGDVAADVRKAFIGTAYMREKMVATLTRAAEAYDRKRYEEALRLGRTVADATPGVAPVRELTGLAAYRGERWSMAKIHLKAHFTITGDPEHLALVMDCDRANHRYRAVEKTFAQLEESEPTAEVLIEGRIVMASAWADQQMYTEAIELLTRAGGTKQLRNPSFRHVRLWYALGDIYDRAGDVVSARELFARVVIAEPEAYDAAARLNELGASQPRKNRKRRTTPVSKKKVD